MKIKFLKTALAATAVTAVLSLSAMASGIGAATVDTNALNLRSEPSYGSQVLTIAPKNAVVAVSERTSDGWYKVYYKGYEGYMSTEYAKFSTTLNGKFGKGYIVGSSVRMRSLPNLGSDTLGYYSDGTAMDVVGVSGEWYKVSYAGKIGYVHSDYVKMTLPTVDEANNSGVPDGDTELGQAIVATAKQYLGVPYVYGGSSPSGFDCSGFTNYVYNQHGISTHRITTDIFAYDGVAVSRDKLQAGDIVAFANGGGGSVGHVGIYIGDGDFIHASSGSAKVIISNLSESYYAGYYCGARRVI